MVARTFNKILRKYFRSHLHDKVLDYPLCGKDDKLWFPVDSAMCSGIGCSRCHLRITRNFPALYPRSFPKNIKQREAIDWMYLYAFFVLLKSWNRLPRKSGKQKT